MKKKILATLLAGVMVLSLAACGSSSDSGKDSSDDTAKSDNGSTHIYVLTAAEDHGWTGSVATFAKEKVEEINGDGNYSAEVITSADHLNRLIKSKIS